MNRTEQIGGAGEVLQCDLEEQVLTGLARPHPLADTGVIAGTVLDRLIEDRWVRGQSRDGQLADITFERAARQQISCDVVQPQALPRDEGVALLACCLLLYEPVEVTAQGARGTVIRLLMPEVPSSEFSECL